MIDDESVEEREHGVIYEEKDGIAFITLNRPEKLNAMNQALVKALRNAWIDFEADGNLRVAILTGNGTAFSSGMDLVEAREGNPPDVNACIPNLGVVVTKPIIGAINGWCVGAGMALAAACDIRVMWEEAKFLFPEVKIGYAGGGLEFSKFMSHGVIMEHLLTGDPIEAHRAYEVGLVNRVTPSDQLMEQSIEFAEKIKSNAPLTMKMLKMCYLNQTQSVKSAWYFTEAQYVKPQLESADFREGALAFKEKRKPVFTGS